MSVLLVLICVIPVQLATTLKGVTHALATLDTLATAFFALASTCMFHCTYSNRMHAN